jgi:hypothetical protein
MNFHQTPQSKAADLALNAGLADEVLEEVTPELQQARILDYQAQSLAKPDALEACIGSSNGTLMQMACRLAEVLKEGMVGLNIENFSRVQPVLESYLRVNRQVDRLSHREAELIEARRKADEEQPSLRAAPLCGLPKDAVRSRMLTTPRR